MAARVAAELQSLRYAEDVRRLYHQLRRSICQSLLGLANALEAKDPYTRGHSERVGAWSGRLATALGLPPEEVETITQAGLLHDIGKIGVPDAILLKRGALTEEEWAHMRRHVDYGADILRGIEFLNGAGQIVAQHHERYDGSGYPSGVTGETICLGARIFAVADAVDAMTSDRPYRAALPFEAAADEMIRCSGSHFDPQVVRAFTSVPLDVWQQIRGLAAEPGLIFEDDSTGRKLRYSALALSGSQVTLDGAAGEIVR